MTDLAGDPTAGGSLADDTLTADAAAQAYSRFDCTDPDDETAVGEGAVAARRALEDGACIVLPTDTVYGIGADAFDSEAVQRLQDAKGRGRDKPPPVLIADPGLAQALATEVPDHAQELLNALWPGGLTAIFEARGSSRMDLGETHGTVALRVPDHRLTRDLLRQTGPLAVSSANRTGHPPATSCDQAINQLGDRVAVYLDGGALAATQGKPSTMIDFSRTEDGEVLRLGPIELETLRLYLPDLTDLSPEDSQLSDARRLVTDLRARHTLQPPFEQQASSRQDPGGWDVHPSQPDEPAAEADGGYQAQHTQPDPEVTPQAMVVDSWEEANAPGLLRTTPRDA